MGTPYPRSQNAVDVVARPQLSKLHDQACETDKPVESSSVTCLYHPDDEQHEVDVMISRLNTQFLNGG
jgi:hypothetical protein